MNISKIELMFNLNTPEMLCMALYCIGFTEAWQCRMKRNNTKHSGVMHKFVGVLEKCYKMLSEKGNKDILERASH